MVDVSAKAPSARVAVASAELRTTPKVLRAPELIPLCHPLPVEAVTVDFEIVEPDSVRITAAVTVVAKTGVEMEALTAVSVAALTLYDMCKSADKGITIGPIRLESKTGGKSGSYRREK
jgi:cyclic pyranopterin phosphate synthase